MSSVRNLHICFMGTPDFAVESLKAMVENSYVPACVVTAPDKPAGRGKKLQSSAVKQYAEKNNLPVLQPQNLKDEEFENQLKQFKINVIVVVAFRMLPDKIWQLPEFGTFNLHASLLPNYRGAAPINWAVINGEKETGITTFFIEKEIDTGNIIFQKKITIDENDTAGIVHDKLMIAGSGLVLKTLEAIKNNSASAIRQEELITENSDIKAAPKIFKNTCRINWNVAGQTIQNHIRGLSPYPTAWTVITNDLDVINIKVFKSTYIPEQHELVTGTVVTDLRKQLKVATIDGFIQIEELQQAGKKRMNAQAFLAGFKHITEYRFS
jgi:methionyl-tRNA formyltransferase